MKRLAVYLLFLFSGIGVFALDGREVMEKVDSRERGKSSHAVVRMDLIDKKGSVNTRNVEMYAAEDAKGLKKFLVIFHSPASVRNTRYLAVENEGREDDKWIFLPALKRVRRIAAAEGGNSFMGSDFTYDDMSDREVGKDIHVLLKEEKEGPADCYVVESKPKDPKDSQYSKRIAWVDKNRWIPIKIELYDKSGNLQKTALMDSIEKVQGFWTPLKTTMKNIQTGTATVLTMEKFAWDEGIPPGLFTSRFLETGRP
jgi:outer membrane lipoprotein-sorting protein